MRAGRGLVAVLVREVLPTAVVGVMVFQLIRAVGFERYLVPSASMEPTLHGNPESGDLVLVNKLAYRWGKEPERFDLVVLENPEQSGAHLVKRAVAFADETVLIRDGDLFVGADGGPLARLEREPTAHRDMWQPWFEWSVGTPWTADADDRMRGRGEDFAVGDQGLELAPAEASAVALLERVLDEGEQQARMDRLPPVFHPPGVLTTGRSVDASFLCAHGVRLGRSAQIVRDAAMAVQLVPRPGLEALLLVFEFDQRPFGFCYAVDGTVTLHEWMAPIGRFDAPPLLVGGVRGGAGEPISLQFGHLDGRLFLAVDGATVALHPVATLERERGVVLASAAPRNSLTLACAGAPVLVKALTIQHDIHYVTSPVARRDAPERWVVDSDEIFLLGDNTMDSRDSRERHCLASDLLGRPMMVLGPWPRTRWL